MADRAKFDRWCAAMAVGDFEKAWEIGDTCLNAHAQGIPLRNGAKPVWQGESLAGKRILVCCYHGLGDTIQFIRFAAPLRRIAREVIVLAQRELVSLIARVSGVDRVLPLHARPAADEYDLQIEIMELAHALRADAAAVWPSQPYLSASGSRCPDLPAGEGKTIGLVWRVGDWYQNRSLPAHLLRPLGALRNIRLYSLQRGPAASDAALIPALDCSSDDTERTATVLLSLDLLISVDTFVAHLAGALGVPVWLLLQHDCDWRWMKNRSDCVWYPTMRLFRQPRQGDWHSVVADVCDQLTVFAR